MRNKSPDKAPSEKSSISIDAQQLSEQFSQEIHELFTNFKKCQKRFLESALAAAPEAAPA